MLVRKKLNCEALAEVFFYHFCPSIFSTQDGQCRFKPSTVGATCTGYVDVASGDENALKEAVATIGPVSVAIDAGHSSFQLYESGNLGFQCIL